MLIEKIYEVDSSSYKKAKNKAKLESKLREPFFYIEMKIVKFGKNGYKIKHDIVSENKYPKRVIKRFETYEEAETFINIFKSRDDIIFSICKGY